MHIEDGILSPKAWTSWYAASTVFIVPGISQKYEKELMKIYTINLF